MLDKVSDSLSGLKDFEAFCGLKKLFIDSVTTMDTLDTSRTWLTQLAYQVIAKYPKEISKHHKHTSLRA